MCLSIVHIHVIFLAFCPIPFIMLNRILFKFKKKKIPYMLISLADACIAILYNVERERERERERDRQTDRQTEAEK